jgi:hypothetical protein
MAQHLLACPAYLINRHYRFLGSGPKVITSQTDHASNH